MSLAPPPTEPATTPAPPWHWVHADDDFALAAGPGWLAGIMRRPVTDRFHAKQNRNIGRLRLTEQGQEIVVYLKRHFEARSWWRYTLDAILRTGSPARQEFDRLAWVREQGIPVPRAPAAGERVLPGGVRESFLAVEELAGMLALHELIPLAHARLSPDAFHVWKRGLAREVARLAAALHGRRAFHQDLYLCHFYARESDTAAPPADWAGRVAVIDFHRLTWARGPLADWLRVKDLAQLLFSGVGVIGLTPRDGLRVFRHYADLTRCGRWVLTAACWKAARYARHNAKRAG